MANSSRVLSLDILRGIAILMVLVHHSSNELIPGQPETSGLTGFVFWRIRNLGWSGVDLFFVLSGFLIGGLLFSEIERTGRLRCVRFWLRRGLKIWPSYLVLIGLLALHPATAWIDFESFAQFSRKLLIHCLFLHNYLDLGVNGPTWSLAVEEHFYTLLPIVLFVMLGLNKGSAISAKQVGWVVGGCVTGGLLLRVFNCFASEGLQINDFMITHFRFDNLMLGVGLQYFYRHHRESVSAYCGRYRFSLLVAGLILISPSMFISRNEPVMFTIGFTGLAVGYAILLMLVVTHGFGFLESKGYLNWVARVGKWSYNIYLWHFFLPILIWPVYAPVQEWLGSLPLPTPILLIPQIVFYAGLSIFSGAFFTFIVENPFLKLRKRWVPSHFRPQVV